MLMINLNYPTTDCKQATGNKSDHLVILLGIGFSIIDPLNQPKQFDQLHACSLRIQNSASLL
ncbi:hypothetical protein CDL15_Pgr023518 [Punica granatum]|uniref:Uncharacterized protein n=1 Tax=Punica granatum TaxID=22663 RepID=A0A218W7N5_PUNGR|nr:hypothetical protein CDL15_Pgr023518 [Punica granatum]